MTLLCFLLLRFFKVRFKILTNNHLQIRGIKKTDEGAYTCEARVMTRGEIDLKIIKVIVNGEYHILPLTLPLVHRLCSRNGICIRAQLEYSVVINATLCCYEHHYRIMTEKISLYQAYSNMYFLLSYLINQYSES